MLSFSNSNVDSCCCTQSQWQPSSINTINLQSPNITSNSPTTGTIGHSNYITSTGTNPHMVDTYNTYSTGGYASISIDDLIRQVLKENEKKEKEEKEMNIPSMKFDFGPANSDVVAMSPYGLAIRCGDAWYAYNAKEGQTIDVTGMTFNFKNAIYKMPVAVNQIHEGDLIIHQKKAMYVTRVNDKASIEVIDLAASEQKTVIPISNMFGFNYITKIAPLFNFGNITPSAENPFGNILPMMMMSSLFEDDKNNKGEGNDFMQMMFMMSLMNGTNPFDTMFAGFGPKAE